MADNGRPPVVSGLCWLWSGQIDAKGYGRVSKRAYRPVLAHRAVYLALVGPVPEGLELDHLCRVESCVNPAHLEPVTHQVNCARGANSGVETHCKKGHLKTGALDPRGYGRNCLVCTRARRRKEQKTLNAIGLTARGTGRNYPLSRLAKRVKYVE